MRWLLAESFVRGRGRVRRLDGHFLVLLVQWFWIVYWVVESGEMALLRLGLWNSIYGVRKKRERDGTPNICATSIALISLGYPIIMHWAAIFSRLSACQNPQIFRRRLGQEGD